jgi:hypothetical protein
VATEFYAEVPGALHMTDAGHMVAGDRSKHVVEAIVRFPVWIRDIA